MSEKITFIQLKTELAKRAGQEGMPPAKQSANAQSALKSFWVERGFDEDEVVAANLRADYLAMRDAHLATVTAGRNRRNRRWLLNFAAYLVGLLDYESALAANAPTPLQAELRALFADGTRKVTPTAREIGVSLETIKRWLAGHLPHRDHVPVLSRLEDVCKLVPGTLTKLLPFRPPTHREMKMIAKELPRDEYLERSSRLREEPFYLPIDVISEHAVLKHEWMTLLADKVRGATVGEGVWTAEMVKARASASTAELENPWRLRALRDGEQPRWFDCIGANRVPTGEMVFDKVRMFLGWACRSQEIGGAGMPLESFCLALLTDGELIERFFVWHVARIGCPTTTHMDFLKSVMTLLSAGKGYIARTPSLGARVDIIDEAVWRERCANARMKLASIRRNFRKEVKTSRKKKQLQAVLELENPVSAIVRGVLRLKADIAAYSGLNAPIHKRDLLLLTLSTSNPLRAVNFSAMTYEKDNSGELRKMSDGAWRIFIDRNKMKNIRGAAKDRDYDQPVDPEVWPFIEAYLKVRDRFNASGYVFAPALNRSRTHGRYLTEKYLSDTFRSLTQSYVPELPRGAGIHGIRTIRTTHEIVTTGDYVHAAYLLHDKEKTVRDHYAIVLNAYHERQRAMRGATSALAALKAAA